MEVNYGADLVNYGALETHAMRMRNLNYSDCAVNPMLLVQLRTQSQISRNPACYRNLEKLNNH